MLIRLGTADLHAAINNHRDMEGRTAVRPSISRWYALVTAIIDLDNSIAYISGR